MRLSAGGGTDIWEEEGPEGGRDKGGDEFGSEGSESTVDETECFFCCLRRRISSS